MCNWIECANGGLCQSAPNSTFGYKCRCQFGFTGVLCEDRVNVTSEWFFPEGVPVENRWFARCSLLKQSVFERWQLHDWCRSVGEMYLLDTIHRSSLWDRYWQSYQMKTASFFYYRLNLRQSRKNKSCAKHGFRLSNWHLCGKNILHSNRSIDTLK